MRIGDWIRTVARTSGTLLLIVAGWAQSAPVEQLWERIYNGGHSDAVQSLALDASGNVYVLGYSVNEFNNPGFLTIKYSPDGTPIWQRFYDGGSPGVVVVNDSGEAWVMGLGETTNSAFYLTIKYDADGNQLWVRRLAGFNQWGTEPRGFSVDRFGNAVV